MGLDGTEVTSLVEVGIWPLPRDTSRLLGAFAPKKKLTSLITLNPRSVEFLDAEFNYRTTMKCNTID